MARHEPFTWYALGRTLGEARSLLGVQPSNPEGPGEDPPAGGGGAAAGRHRPDPPFPTPVTGTLAGAAGAVLFTALERWLGRRRPPFHRLVRGAVAGAGAAGLLVAFRGLLVRDEEVDLLDELLSGAGKGVIYASLLDPFLPGPPVLRGSMAGTLDYLLSPSGGVFSRLQTLSPARKLPVISILLEAGEAEEEPYLAFLCYGAALGLLYGEPGPQEASLPES